MSKNKPTSLLTVLAISFVLLTSIAESGAIRGQSSTVTLTLGSDLPASPIYPLLGVNTGPVPAGNTGNPELTTQYQQAGITMVRTHDFTGPFDLAQIYPDQDADPTSAASYRFLPSDQIFTAIIDGGFEPYLRIGNSFSNGRPITNRSNVARAAVEIVRHYSDSARWGANHLRYVEIWNEPNNMVFWTGTQAEFIDLFAQTARALKTAFPSLMIGGPGWGAGVPGGSFGQNYVRDFLTYMQANNVPLDFMSWHMYSNDPADFVSAASYYRSTLNSFGYTAAESHITEWNTRIESGRDQDPALRTGARGAAVMSAAWIGLQQQNVAASTFYRGTDPSMDLPTFHGIFYANGQPKPTALAFSLWSQMAAHPLRNDLTVSSSSATELRVLAGHNVAGEICFLIANPTNAPISWQLALPNSSNYTATLKQVTDAASSVQTSSLTSLNSQSGAYATQLVTLSPIVNQAAVASALVPELQTVAPASLAFVYLNLNQSVPLTLSGIDTQSGTFPTSVSGYQVLMAGSPVQIFSLEGSATAGRIGIVLPENLLVGTNSVLVKYVNQAGIETVVATGTAITAATAPALATSNGAGSGTLLALENPDLMASLGVTTNPLNTTGFVELSLFGTGLRGAPDTDATNNLPEGPPNVAESYILKGRLSDGREIPITIRFVGPAPGMPGTDQVLVIIPTELRGQQNVTLLLSERSTNTVANLNKETSITVR